MDRNEFERAWHTIPEGTLHVVVFTGGMIFAHHMQIILVRKQTLRSTTEYYNVELSKNVGGISVETGTIRLKSVRRVI